MIFQSFLALPNIRLSVRSALLAVAGEPLNFKSSMSSAVMGSQACCQLDSSEGKILSERTKPLTIFSLAVYGVGDEKRN